jgi:hypothetical protein
VRAFFHTFVFEIRAAGVVCPVSFHVGVNDDAENMIELWLILGERVDHCRWFDH